MSNKPENFVAYFKIKWSRMPTWSIYEAAALSCGKDPDLDECKVGPEEVNPVSKRYYWLCNQSKKGGLGPNFGDNESFSKIRHNTGSMLRRLEEHFSCYKDIRKTLDYMYQAPYGINHTKFVSRSTYREAGCLIFKKYPLATKGQVAKVLVDLPNYYNNDDFGQI